ncbi:hypothetical protein [Epilithonimonas caeni]|uniref:hypothetical protein n=1 Tax=Epilithonimonas caeni TaxID=365343 RepID=UPI0012EC559C|nr:hypothetical protein [Epilithonimonas caeni]
MNNNNSLCSYDSTSYGDFNPQQESWPAISNIIAVSDFIGFGFSGIPRNCMDYAKAQIAKKGYQISNYFDVGQTFNL